jgi:hypothetical protein
MGRLAISARCCHPSVTCGTPAPGRPGQAEINLSVGIQPHIFHSGVIDSMGARPEAAASMAGPII